ncbi:MAG: VWA domain-containing protein [Terriglobales bacterium]
MTGRRPILWITLFCLATGWLSWRLSSAPVAHAQQDAAATLKAEARLVLVDTVVTDKKGNYIHDLTAKDFRVWEDNKEQTITSFSSEADNASSPSQRHYLVLFFDNSSMEFGEQARARDAAAKFIDANAGPNRLIAIVEFGGVLKITQNFTADAARLKRVVSGIKTSAVASNQTTDNSTPSIADLQGSAEVASLGTPPLGMPSLSTAEADFGARSVMIALRNLAKNLSTVPGRKSLVMLTSGFPLTIELESELTAVIDACNKYNVAVYPIDVRGLVAPVLTGPSGAELRGHRRVDSARLMSATLKYLGNDAPQPHLVLVQHGGPPSGGGGHPGGGSSGGGSTGGGSHGGGTGSTGGGSHGSTGGGTRGSGGTTTGARGGALGTPQSSYYNSTFRPREIVPQFPPSASDNQQVLYALASGTGGFVILNTNDLLGGMQRIASELSEYYLLGYSPADTPEGSCHTLRVKVERGGTEVRSRSGYCNVKPADFLAGQPIEKDLESQAKGTQPGTVSAPLAAPFFYTSANLARVNLVMDIPSNSIKFEKVKGKMHATVNVLGIASKPDGSVAARFSDAVNLDFDDKKGVEQFVKQPFPYENQFDLVSGQYTLKVAFSSGGEGFGKIEVPLDIDPYDGKVLSLSSMALSRDVRKVSDLASGLDAALMEDRTLLICNGLEIVPAAVYHFKKTDTAAVYAEVYEPLLVGSDHPQVGFELKVVDKVGAAKFDTGLQDAETFMKTGSPVIPLGLKLPVATLDPGSYRVALQAVDSAGNKSKPRSAEFVVE